MNSFGLNENNGTVKKNHQQVQETQETRIQSLGQDLLEEEMAILLQYFCLENSIDRETWSTIVHGVAKSWTPQSARARTHTHTHTHKNIFN